MNAPRVEKAVNARTHEWLNVPKRDVTVYAGEVGGYEYVDIHIDSSIGLTPMDAIRQWLHYLDWITQGRVTICATAAPEIILHEDQSPY